MITLVKKLIPVVLIVRDKQLLLLISKNRKLNKLFSKSQVKILQKIKCIFLKTRLFRKMTLLTEKNSKKNLHRQ